MKLQKWVKNNSKYWNELLMELHVSVDLRIKWMSVGVSYVQFDFCKWNGIQL